MATSEKWTDKKTGEKKERTEWHTVKVWGAFGDLCAKYLVKGQSVVVRGKIQYDQDKTDEKKWYTSIKADDVEFGPKPGGVQSTNAPTTDSNHDVPPGFDDTDEIPW